MSQLEDRRASFAQYLRGRFSGGHAELADHLSEVPNEEILSAFMKGHMSEAIVLDDSQVNHILLENGSNEEAFRALSDARHQKHIDDVRAAVAKKYTCKMSTFTCTNIPGYYDLVDRLIQFGIDIEEIDIDDIMHRAMSFYSDWVCDERAWKLDVHRSKPRMSYQDLCEACLLAQSLDKYPTFTAWMMGELTGEMEQSSVSEVKCEMYSTRIISFLATETLDLINECVPYDLSTQSKALQNRILRVHGELITAMFVFLSSQSLYTAWVAGLPYTQKEEQTRSEQAEFMDEVERHFKTLYPKGCSRNQHKKFLCDLKNLAATLDAEKLWLLSNEGIPMDIPMSLVKKAQSVIERELEKKASADGEKIL